MTEPDAPTDLSAAFLRYVQPDRRHMRLLHGSLTRRMADPERAAFLRELIADANRVDDAELTDLLGRTSGWQERIVAAWMAGIDDRTGQRDRIGELLIESSQTYAGQGYCFALSCFATPADAEILSIYLDRYLRQPDLHYDQDWAIGALLDVDAQLGSDYAASFIGPDGLWQQWTGADSMERLDACRDRLASLRALVEQTRATTVMTDVGNQEVRLPEGWIPIPAGDGTAFEAELAAELAPAHPLANRPAIAIAYRDGYDHVLFEITEEPRRWALVVLTRSGAPGPQFRPSSLMFASLETAAARIPR